MRFGIAFFVGIAFAAEIPIGTRIEIRLTSAVNSRER